MVLSLFLSYRYIRVFCREIFLNKACKTERGFWMAQILKNYPMFFQARLLFILYGPTDHENGKLCQKAK